MAQHDSNQQVDHKKVRGVSLTGHFTKAVIVRSSLLLVVILGIGFGATAFIHAAPSAIETDAGNLSSTATLVTDTSGSGGKAVRFGSAPVIPGDRACPPLPAYPDANCTGVLPGVARTNASTQTISQNGAVIENLEFSGRLTITGDNVIIRNIKLTTSDYWGLLVYGKNATVTDSTFIGAENTQAPLAAIDTGSLHATRVNVSGGPDGVTLGNDSSLTDSYVHDLGDYPGAHNDGVNADKRTNVSIIHNRILNSIGQTSAITIGTTEGPSTVVARDNWLAGGGYTIYSGIGGGAGKGIEVTNNVFSRQYYPNCGYFGPVAYWQNGNGNIWSNNRYDNGVPVGP